MQEFEVIGLEDGDGRQPLGFDESSVTNPNPPQWWLLVPVAVAFGLLFVLSRGAMEQAVEDAAATTVPVSTTVPNETDEDDSANSPLTGEDLLASFEGQVLLTGASGREIIANDLAAGTSFSLGVRGDPLFFVDGWLVFIQEEKVKVLNLMDPASEPFVILAGEPSGSGFDVLVDAGAELLTLTQFSYDGLSADATAFAIGSWEQAIAVDNAGQGYRSGGVVSSPGNGVFELTADGYRRRGDGLVVGVNRELVVTWECDRSLARCRTRVHYRATWNEVMIATSGKETPSTNFMLAPEGSLALRVDWLQESFDVVDLLSGDRTELDVSGLGNPFFDQFLGSSEVAALIAADEGTIYIADRVSGEVTQLRLADGLVARQGLLVKSSLPYVLERIQ